MTSKEKALDMWKIHTYYWNEPELIAKQQIILQIAGIVRALKMYKPEDVDYWNEVKKHIYEI